MKINITDPLQVFALAAAVAAMAGCHSTPTQERVYVPIPISPHTASANDGIWVPDQLSAYSVGRYVDPSDSAVMHDAHTLYRVEQTGRWNLAPTALQPASSLAVPAGQPDTVLLRDALTAELNRQRAASLALVEQARILDAHLRELNAQSQEFRDAVKQFSRLRDQMTVVSNRLNTIDDQLRTLPASGRSP